MSTNKTVTLITGANKGLGLESARQLGKMGHCVLIGARDESKGRAAVDTLRSDDIDAHYVRLDVTDSASISQAAQFIERTFGKLDVLVNNAGVFVGAWDVPPSKLSVQDIRKNFETNVFGLIEVTQTMLPLLKKSAAGRIVNLSSILGSMAAHQDPKSGVFGMLTMGYNASKSAVNMFTVNLAHELKKTAIKVNAAHPGWVKTDMGTDAAPMVVEDGVKTTVWLATLPADGPTGGYFHMQQALPW
jgi:NAD(P)-dependent dehydrogenase (short-subunit alcohol dehydrogenase family)